MITRHIFKALIAVNCLEVAVKQGRLNRRSGIWDASGKMSKTGRGRKGYRITKRGNGECKVQPLLSPVNLEYRAYTNLVGFGCLLHKQWKGYIAPLSRPVVFVFLNTQFIWPIASYIFVLSQRSKIRNDFM